MVKVNTVQPAWARPERPKEGTRDHGVLSMANKYLSCAALCRRLVGLLTARPRPPLAATTAPASRAGRGSSPARPRQRRRAQGDRGAHGDQIFGRDDQGRPRPEELQAEPRSIHGQARRPRHCRPRQRHEICQCRACSPRSRSGMAFRLARSSPSGAWRLRSAASWATSRRSPPVATLAYDCRRPEYFTDQLYAALQLVDRGVLERRDTRRHAWRSRPDPVPAEEHPALWRRRRRQRRRQSQLQGRCAGLDRQFPQRPWLGQRRGLSARRAELCRHPGLERGRRLSASHRHHRQAHRRRASGRPKQRGLVAPANLRYLLERDASTDKRPKTERTVVPRACPSARQADRARARRGRRDPHRALLHRRGPARSVRARRSSRWMATRMRAANGAEYRLFGIDAPELASEL